MERALSWVKKSLFCYLQPVMVTSLYFRNPWKVLSPPEVKYASHQSVQIYLCICYSISVDKESIGYYFLILHLIRPVAFFLVILYTVSFKFPQQKFKRKNNTINNLFSFLNLNLFFDCLMDA